MIMYQFMGDITGLNVNRNIRIALCAFWDVTMTSDSRSLDLNMNVYLELELEPWTDGEVVDPRVARWGRFPPYPCPSSPLCPQTRQRRCFRPIFWNKNSQWRAFPPVVYTPHKTYNFSWIALPHTYILDPPLPVILWCVLSAIRHGYEYYQFCIIYSQWRVLLM